MGFIQRMGLFGYLVCRFGMNTSGCSLQRLMDMVKRDPDKTSVYVDDLIVHFQDWSEHTKATRALFEKLRKHGLTVGLEKSEFVHATVKYLGPCDRSRLNASRFC